MWIYNGEMLINLENGVNLHPQTTNPMYGGYEAAVVLAVPVGTERDSNNWIFEGTAAECAYYIFSLSKDLDATNKDAYGTKTEPEPEPEPRHVPTDYSDQCSSDIPF